MFHGELLDASSLFCLLLSEHTNLTLSQGAHLTFFFTISKLHYQTLTAHCKTKGGLVCL